MKFEDQPELKELSRKRQLFSRARTILQREKEAGIPEKYSRINEQEFKSVLCPDYHADNMDKIASLIGENANRLLKIPFILIDGGNINARKKAGHALLFRLIACNMRGLHRESAGLASKLQLFVSYGDVSRNDYAERLKRIGALFISEFYPIQFRTASDAGRIYDEILSYRSDNILPTIISFTDAISAARPITNKECGIHIADFSSREHCKNSDHSVNPSEEYLRIRVRVAE